MWPTARYLLNTLVGTQGKYTTEDVTSYQKDLIVSRLTDMLGQTGVSLLELPARYDEIAVGSRAKVAEDFSKYGLELVDLFVSAITPPEEVQKAIDTRSSMGVVGDLNAYMKFQAAQSMSKMAERGGDGGAMGMGFGAGMGMMMPQMMREAMQTGGAAGGPAAPGAAAPSRPAAGTRPQVCSTSPSWHAPPPIPKRSCGKFAKAPAIRSTNKETRGR